MSPPTFIVAVTVMVIRKDRKENEFLLIKRADTDIIYPGLWSPPGGKIDPTREFKYEPSIKDKGFGNVWYHTLEHAASFELFEEANVYVPQEDMRYLCSIGVDRANIIIACFWAVLDTPLSRVEAPGKDIEAIGYFTLDQVMGMDCVPGIKEEIMIVDRLNMRDYHFQWRGVLKEG